MDTRWKQLRKYFFPINIDNIHWVAGVVDVSRKTIIYYDPLYKGNCNRLLSRSTRGVKKELQKLTELEDLYKLVSYLFCSNDFKRFEKEWNLEYENGIHVPRQNDGYNYGIDIALCISCNEQYHLYKSTRTTFE